MRIVLIGSCMGRRLSSAGDLVTAVRSMDFAVGCYFDAEHGVLLRQGICFLDHVPLLPVVYMHGYHRVSMCLANRHELELDVNMGLEMEGG
jgi:hypothetical protein